MDENQKIDAYIQQIMKIKAQKDLEQEQIDYNELSRELGFDDADLQMIEQERIKLVDLGRGYVQHQQADDAIEALEKAYNIKSNDESTLQYLAEAYGIKYVKTNKPEYKGKSEDFASICLQINPNNQSAFKIIQAIRYKPKQQLRWGNVAVFGILLMVVGGIAFTLFSRSTPDSSSGKNYNTTESVTVTSSDNSRPVSSNALTIKGMNGTNLVFDVAGDKATINYGSQTIVSKAKGSEKRKYYNGSGTQLLEVKMYPGEDRFKVRTNDGKELWKVKWYPDKIKIENEAQKLTYEVKSKETGKMKATKNDEEIGDAKLNGDGNKIKVEKGGNVLYEVPVTANKFSYGVLAIDEIPEQEKLIIVAELMMRSL